MNFIPASTSCGTQSRRSTFQPTKASLRLQIWKPPNPKASQIIPHLLQSRVVEVRLASLRESTKRTYGAGLLQFHNFCTALGIPEEQRAPCSPEVLSAFIASMAGSFAGSTVNNYVQAVRAWHLIHGLDWNMSDSELHMLLKASDNLTPPASRRAPREPFTVRMLEEIRQNLDLDAPFDIAVFACLTTTFYSCARLGEFTVPSRESFNLALHVKLDNVSIEEDREGRQTHTFALPSTKTSARGERVYWSRQDGASDPLSAFQRHLQINQPPFDGHLFAYKWEDTHRPMTKPDFMRRIQTAMVAAGLPRLQGHSLRIGSTLEYLLRGIPFETVKSIGRWKSDAFTIYLRKHAQILAPYLQAVPEAQAVFNRLTTTG